ncbi:MAG TPA: hypothetical protein VGS09_05540 [Actinomycetota bacterium]|nr:hypothetical protein [Actinomycetota bacterium]
MIFFLLAYDVTAPAFESEPGRDFVDTLIAFFQNEQARWPQEVVASLLFAAGFLLLVALAWLLRYGFGRDDVRAGLASSALAVGGFLGAASQLIYLGAKQVAIDPHYCDCVYAPEQIISQDRALALADGTQRWLIMGFLLIAAIGLYLFGRLALDREVGGPWATVSFVGAAVSIVDLIAATFELDLLFQIGWRSAPS